MSPRGLSRAAVDRPAAPVRAAHLGLGAFFKAHAAWYTAHGNASASPWGIDAFTGRRPDAADRLRSQDGLYTLVVRGPDGDAPEIVDSVVEAHDGADVGAWLARAADPALGVVTLTVTEYAYRRAADGTIDTADPDVRSDLAALRAAGSGGPMLRTVPGRLVAGLAARRAAGGGPLALVSCDNLPGNGDVLAAVVSGLAGELDGDPRYSGLRGWITGTVRFPTTMVDRITPATTGADRETAARLTGFTDAAPVVTEPFTEWVLAGDFPAGRPAWELSGARFVDDVSPFEDRKLWLLNGSHSMLAYTAPPLGFTTVAEAVADPGVRQSLGELWDTATPYLRLPASEIAEYRQALLVRYANPNIAHRLAQIAASGSQKLAIRIVPLLRRHLADGHAPPVPLTRVLGGWLAHLRGVGAPVDDPLAATLVPTAQGELRAAARRVVAVLAEDLAHNGEVVAAVAAAAVDIERRARG